MPIRHIIILTLTIACCASSGYSQGFSITPEAYVAQFSVLEHITVYNPPERDNDIQPISRPQLRLRLIRETKGNYDYGISASLLNQSKYISFDYYRPDPFTILSRYATRIEHRFFSISGVISRAFGKLRLSATVGLINEYSFKDRITSTEGFEYFIQYTLTIGSDDVLKYRLGAFGVEKSKSRNSLFSAALASLSMNYLVSERFGLTGIIHYRRFPGSMMAFRTYEVSELTEYPETGGLVIDERNGSRPEIG